jgi:3-oxoacyl-[acyl-carrier protein] reductase
MDLGIRGRTAVVTGASRGIGAATAALLEAEGARVVAVSRGTGIDVTAPDAAGRIAALAGAPVDILVNNAGTSYAKALDELTDEDWNGQWELHVLACMRLMRAFAPGMAERGWGRIVNVASSAGKRPSLTNAAYSVTKAAQLSLSRVFADTYAADGVLVNAVAPGAVASSLWMAEGGLADQTAAARGLSRQEAIEAQEAKVPVGRFATEEEIASVVAFLCSERASIVAGAAWSVDGGTVATIV